MKIAVYKTYGDPSVYQIDEVERPTLKHGEVLVEIKASSVNPVDCKLRRGNWKLLTSFNNPKRSGSDFSGIIRASNIHGYRPGDHVFGMLNPVKGGAYAEFAVVKENQMYRSPKNLEFHQSGVVPLAGLTALQTMKYKGKIRKGHHVLINACCGGVGHFAVQYGKAMGAKVTGICSSAKVQLARELGVDVVIDYKKQNVYDEPGGFDIVLDPIGSINFKKIQPNMNYDGKLIAFVPSRENMIGWLSSFITSKKLKFYLTDVNSKDLKELTELIEAGKIMPHVQNIYSLNQVSLAHQEVEDGHAAGKIAIRTP